jgi:hypothetical protein
MSNAKKRTHADVKNVEDRPRTSFTPGWSKSISEVDALPVKRDGKVVRVMRMQEDREVSDVESEEEAEVEQKVRSKGKNRTKAESDDAGDGEDVERPKKVKAEKVEKPMVFVEKSRAEIHRLQQKIAEICSAIVASPEGSLKKKAQKESSGDDDGEDFGATKYRMVDLFDMLRSSDAQEFEMAMLSALLVFKDICPSYRIRSSEEYDKEVQLKKETKSMKDFELSLLGAYQKYLKILETRVQKGLGSAKREISTWGMEEKLGLSALRCQCELLRSLSHFNFRTQILATVALRATQPNDDVSALCCDTLSNLLSMDTQGELSYEVVRDIGKVLMLCKYNTTERVVRCLNHAKMTVHADDAKSVHRKAKSERKKRKQNQDEVELGLLESNATADTSNKKRFHADCLHEICLIYFRIVKGKVGFSLLPAALDGLSRITHLMNIDMVQDLMVCLKSILEEVNPAPVPVQLQCVHCALRTLSGPGAELNLDSDIYLHKLRTLIRDLPAGFAHWDAVLECMDLCFLKKREERANIVQSFARLLLMSAVHLSHSIAPVIYAMAHAILLRYPRVRQDMLAVRFASTAIFGAKNTAPQGGTVAAEAERKVGKSKAPVLFTEDEAVEDLAMKCLREESVGETHLENVQWDYKEDSMGDGSWLLPLQRLHVDPRYTNITSALSHKELLPMPLRITDAATPATETIIQRLVYCTQQIPHKLPGKGKASNGNNGNKTNGGNPVAQGSKQTQNGRPQQIKGGNRGNGGKGGKPKFGKSGKNGKHGK